MENGNRKLFLSYAWKDDQPFVKRLYADLIRYGYDPWMDVENMSSRGRALPQEVIDSLSVCGRLIPIIGRGWLASPACQAERAYALSIGKVISPVLRDDVITFADLPQDLKKFLIIDFTARRNYEDGLADILRILEEPAAPPGPLFAVPSLPPHYQPRSVDLKAIRDAMEAQELNPVAILAAPHNMALHGMSGIGKTVIAVAYAHDYETRRRFLDGIIWLNVRRDADLLVLLRRLGATLRIDVDQWTSVEDAKPSLQRALDNKAFLLILDDVWQLHHAQTFLDILGPRCRALLTTRDETLANKIGAKIWHLQRLKTDEARSLLARTAGVDLAALPVGAEGVTQHCGNLPFAVVQCGAVIRNGTSWSDLLSALTDTDVSFFAEALPNYDYPDIYKAIQVSVDFVDREVPGTAKRYVELAVFPAAEVPEDAAVKLWTCQDTMSEPHARKLLTTLHNLALVERLEGTSPDRRFSLHDLQVDYVRKFCGDRLTELHNVLLDGYERRCHMGQLGPSESYFFRYLAHHIKESARTSRVQQLLTNKPFLRTLALQHKDCNGIYDDLKALLVLLPPQERATAQWCRHLGFPDVKEGSWQHYHEADLRSFSRCLELHYLHQCGAVDPDTQCHVCDSVGGIVHGTIDMGGYTPSDYNDNYIAWCVNCNWSSYEFQIDWRGTGPAPFNYKTNTYDT